MRHQRLIQGNSLVADWDGILAGRKVDLLMLDPPYGTTELGFDSKFDIMTLCANLYSHLAPAAWVFMWGPLEIASKMLAMFRRKFEYIWEKPRGASKKAAVRPHMNHEILWAFVRRDFSRPSELYFNFKTLRTPGKPYAVKYDTEATSEHAVLNRMQPANRRYQLRNWGYREGVTVLPARQKGMMRPAEACDHPTLKPLAILEPVLRAYCPPDGLVLDPCAGAGSTMLAAFNVGRDCVCIERDKRFVSMATERLTHIPEPIQVLRAPGQLMLDSRGRVTQ